MRVSHTLLVGEEIGTTICKGNTGNIYHHFIWTYSSCLTYRNLFKEYHVCKEIESRIFFYCYIFNSEQLKETIFIYCFKIS